GIDRYIIVTEPPGTKQIFMFYDNWNESLTNELPGKIPTAFASTQIPVYGVASDPPIQTLDTNRNSRNSHYWNRQQSAQLSTSNPLQFNAADFSLSRTKHWLAGYEPINVFSTLSWELPP